MSFRPAPTLTCTPTSVVRNRKANGAVAHETQIATYRHDCALSSLTGPQLVMLCDDLARAAESRAVAEGEVAKMRDAIIAACPYAVPESTHPTGAITGKWCQRCEPFVTAFDEAARITTPSEEK